jgi:murein DD-endopeptidase MepM/ murein hydrolase activator NlpD
MPGNGSLIDASGDWRTAVTTEALKHLGVPYVWGGATPAGWDCSGFVQWVFQQAAGVSLPRVAGDQAGVGVNVGLDAIRPGDLVFFANTYAPGISHVGIYLGNGQFVQASRPGAATIVSSLNEPYYVQHFAGARQPVADGGDVTPPSIPMPDGPALAPAQMLPIFDQAAQLTGVPKEVLLGIARVESGFDPHAVGPYLARFAGTDDTHALGMMQFLPSTYRGYIGQVDRITGKNLGISGIWDGESSIYAAALYLRDNGAPGDMHRALYAYNNAEWYVNLVLAWSQYYNGGVMPDPTMFTYDGSGRPLITATPENPLQPVQTDVHLDITSPLPLYAPFPDGQVWHSGGNGNFYGQDTHSDADGAYYAVDFNRGTLQQPEDSAGQPVLAVADGIINNVYATFGGGWTVEMYHRTPEGTLLRSVYEHLKDDPRVSAKIAVNQAVPHGTVIGYVGDTGVSATGMHLHFALYIWQDKGWISIRPEPMEGRALTDGGTVVSHNQVSNSAAFTGAWGLTDQSVATGTRQSWLWGPQPFNGSLLEGYLNANGQNTGRVVQYYDKGRMERQDDGKGGFIITVGRLGWELLTGKLDLGGGKTADLGPANVPIVGPLRPANPNDPHSADQLAPTYAAAAIAAANPTLDYKGVPVTWKLQRDGKIVPFTTWSQVKLTNYDPVTKHNVADVFANWYNQTFFTSPDGDPAHTLNALTNGHIEGLDPGHPLTDPFWVEVTIDGTPRVILVQIFERWTLTYSPNNPAGWQVELANMGLHYFEWRYDGPAREAVLNVTDQGTKQRRTTRRRKTNPAA